MELAKVIAFDCFGTVFDASGVRDEELRSYIWQTKEPQWAPLDLPSSWYTLPAHPDAVEGIKRLRTKFRVVTCSNLPLRMLSHLSHEAGIEWDAIIPLEANRAYKPRPAAYMTVCEVLHVEPQNVLVVSAHMKGPDLTGAPGASVSLRFIRNPGHPETIIELAEQLGC